MGWREGTCPRIEKLLEKLIGIPHPIFAFHTSSVLLSFIVEIDRYDVVMNPVKVSNVSVTL